jgi:hypothetical protein
MPPLTIEIPDARARRLAWLASEQNKSVEQVTVEELRFYSSRQQRILRNNMSGFSGRVACLWGD